ATSLAGRTQQGNNNAYCQDNAITWFDWSAADLDLLAFPGGCWRGGGPPGSRGTFPPARRWRRPTRASPMRGARRSISTAQMTPTAPPAVAAGHDDFLVLVNGWWEPLDFTIPVTRPAAGLAPGNRHVRPAATRPAAAASQQLRVGPRSVLELRGPLKP